MPTATKEKTGLGNYFVANYPPFSAWKPAPPARRPRPPWTRPPQPRTPLGLYLHIPFCRKRCKFCYFRVYTDKNARDVEIYLRCAASRKSSCTAGQPMRRRPAARVRLFRRRHAVVPERGAAPRA